MYKEELKEQALKAIAEFFQAEQGNRLTIYSANGLSMHIDSLFENNKIEDSKKK